MTPEARAAFRADIIAAVPGFVALDDEVVAALKARKSALLAGVLPDGRRVVAKRPLRADDEVWRWYFAREVAAYRTLAVGGIARAIHASPALLVIELVDGAPLATRRRPHAALAPAMLAAVLAGLADFAALPIADLGPPPSPAVARALRRRMLEDPTAPIAWLLDGIARSPDLDARGKRVMTAAIEAHAPIAMAHGDALLRNIILRPTPTPTPIPIPNPNPYPIPYPNPNPNPIPIPIPIPIPNPIPIPIPIPTPNPNPNPNPNPIPIPIPNPIPIPIPIPNPNPIPYPNPNPIPIPIPIPNPIPIPIPNPNPTSSSGPAPVFIDLECAGTHHADWDRALLAAQLADRAPLERGMAPPRLRAFRALVAFALVRELHFARAFRATNTAALRDELAAVLASL